MQNILLKIGTILSVSFISAFVPSTSIAVVVGFLVYNVINGHGHVLEIAGGKFFLAAVLVSPLGMVGGIIGGLAGWLTAGDATDNNRRIIKWSAVGGFLTALMPACFIGVNTIA